MQELLSTTVKGHLKIVDDLGEVLVDKDNAVHPENMARVISRALSNESNYFIKRIAYGNGGTDIDAALNISFNPPNDGQTPDTRTWDSQLYNETYSEIVDDEDPSIGTGPGSNPTGDPATVANVSGPGVFSSEIGVLSQVTINSVLNKDEPTGQLSSGTDPEGSNFNSSFTFDELGLYTDGLPLSATAGYQDINVGIPSEINSERDTQLLPLHTYNFDITIDSGTLTTITLTTPAAGSGNGVDAPLSAITYGDLCEAINTGDIVWNAFWGGTNPIPGNSPMSVTDFSGNYSTIIGAQTFGFLRVTSGGVPGATSTVVLAAGTTSVGGSPLDPINADLFDSTFGLNNPSGTTLQTPVDGVDAGVQNDPVNTADEAERLLTHVIFAPVLKAANRALTITYTLTVAVARTT